MASSPSTVLPIVPLRASRFNVPAVIARSMVLTSSNEPAFKVTVPVPKLAAASSVNAAVLLSLPITMGPDAPPIMSAISVVVRLKVPVVPPSDMVVPGSTGLSVRVPDVWNALSPALSVNVTVFASIMMLPAPAVMSAAAAWV